MLGPFVGASEYADTRWKGAGQTGAVMGALSHVTVHGEAEQEHGDLGEHSVGQSCGAKLWGKGPCCVLCGSHKLNSTASASQAGGVQRHTTPQKYSEH